MRLPLREILLFTLICMGALAVVYIIGSVVTGQTPTKVKDRQISERLDILEFRMYEVFSTIESSGWTSIERPLSDDWIDQLKKYRQEEQKLTDEKYKK